MPARDRRPPRRRSFFVWTVTQGIVKSGAEPQRTKAGSGQHGRSAGGPGRRHRSKSTRRSTCSRTFILSPPTSGATLAVIRRLRDVAYHLRDTYKTIVIVAPMLRIAPELAKDVTVVEFGLPAAEDFNPLLDRIIDDVKDNPQVRIDLDADGRERLLHAARGLTLKEAENVFAKTLVLDGNLDADDVSVVFSEKQQIIRKSGLLEYYETQEDFAHVAGLENLKQWLIKRTHRVHRPGGEVRAAGAARGDAAGRAGLRQEPVRQGAASLWNLPLLRFDLGRMFSSLVGSSEENVRRAIQTAESVAPAILWIDEIDKALAGAIGIRPAATAARRHASSARCSTWLSEKTAPVFVICHGQRHQPPAAGTAAQRAAGRDFLRRSCPTRPNGSEIFQIHLAKRGRDPGKFDLAALAQASEGFSGAEIEEAIISALFDAFSKRTSLDAASISKPAWRRRCRCRRP